MKQITLKTHVLVRSFYHRKVKGIFGIPYDPTICPSGDWTPYLGTTYEIKQKYGQYDTDECWDYSPVKVCIEMQLNVLWKLGKFSTDAKNFFVSVGIATADGWFSISERAYGILGGNKDNGGTAEELFQLIQDYGLIPYSALNYTDAQANACPTYQDFLNDYFNPTAITTAMLNIGEQSKQFFNLSYQRIGTMWTTPDKTVLTAAMLQAPLAYGIPINVSQWNQVNVPAYVSGNLAHEVGGYKMLQTQIGYPIVDNYLPFLKTLGDGYSLNAVSQAIITATASPASISSPTEGVWDRVWSAVHAWMVKNGWITPLGKIAPS